MQLNNILTIIRGWRRGKMEHIEDIGKSYFEETVQPPKEKKPADAEARVEALGHKIIKPQVQEIAKGHKWTEYQGDFAKIKAILANNPLFRDVQVDLRAELLSTMQNIEDFITHRTIFAGQQEELSVLFEAGGETRAFKVVITKSDKVRVVFDASIANLPEPGNFKTIAAGYNLQEGEKEILLDQKAHDDAMLRNIEREQKTYDILEKSGIKGMPERIATFYYEDAEGIVHQHFIVKFEEGGDLRKAIEGNALKDKAAFAANLAKVLMDFHKTGLSHNDLRPENILLDKYQMPKIIDFGGTTKVGDDKSSVTISFRYMPPEMFPGGIGEFEEYGKMMLLSEEFYPKMGVLGDILAAAPSLAKVYNEMVEPNPEKYAECNNDIYRVLANKVFFNDYLKLAEAYKKTLDPADRGDFDDAIKELSDWRRNNLFELLKTEKRLDAFAKKGADFEVSENFIPQKNDDFALGRILKELYLGCRPGEKPRAEYDQLYSALPDEIKGVIEGLLNPDPGARLTAEQAHARLAAFAKTL